MAKSGLFVFLMMAALPILLVVLNTLQRRYPQGLTARYGWLPRAGMAVVYVLAAVEAYSRSAKVRGGLFLAAGVATALLTLAEVGFRRLEKAASK